MTGDAAIRLDGWALVLGASSGFGEAVSLALARAGMNVFGVHLDRKATLPNVERITTEIKGLGREARFFNVNAADAEKRAEVAAEMQKTLEGRGEMGRVRVMLHSLAFGTLKLFIADPMKDAVTQAQIARGARRARFDWAAPSARPRPPPGAALPRRPCAR